MNEIDRSKSNKCIEEFLGNFRNRNELSHIYRLNNYVTSITKNKILKEDGDIDINEKDYINEKYTVGVDDLIFHYKIFKNLKYLELNDASLSKNWVNDIINTNQYVVDRMMDIMRDLNIDDYNIEEVKYVLKLLITDNDFNHDFAIRYENIEETFRDTIQRMKNYLKNAGGIKVDDDLEQCE